MPHVSGVVTHFVDAIDEDEGVVHDDSGDGQDAAEAHEAQRHVVKDVAEGGTNDAEGDDQQDDEGLQVAFEGDGHEAVEAEENHDGGNPERCLAFALAAGFPFVAPADLRMIGQDLIDDGAHGLADDGGVGGELVDVGGDVQGAAAVHAHDGAEALADLGLSDAGQGQLQAGGGADTEGVEGG